MLVLPSSKLPTKDRCAEPTQALANLPMAVHWARWTVRGG